MASFFRHRYVRRAVKLVAAVGLLYVLWLPGHIIMEHPQLQNNAVMIATGGKVTVVSSEQLSNHRNAYELLPVTFVAITTCIQLSVDIAVSPGIIAIWLWPLWLGILGAVVVIAYDFKPLAHRKRR